MSANPQMWSEHTPFFTLEELALLDSGRIPKHIAIIPDGNRRWAKNHTQTSPQGHQKGADALTNIVKASRELGIKAISFFLFSTENWARSKEEIDSLMVLLGTYLVDQLPPMQENGIRFHTIGDLSRFPEHIKEIIAKKKKETEHLNGIDLILALNYGGRDEMRRAMQQMVADQLAPEEITESTISRYLDTAKWPDPDLLIRTSGEQRVSNFLLWQISYAELYMANVLWPDFTPAHLFDALRDFQKRERRLGGA